MIVMQAPAIRVPRTNREQVTGDEGIGMPVPAWVEHLTNRSAVVGAGRGLTAYQTVWKWLQALTGHPSMDTWLGFCMSFSGGRGPRE